MKKLLIDLVEKAEHFGLAEKDIQNAKEFLKYNEYELCLDILVPQLYEFDIQINQDFYDRIAMISNSMKIELETYAYLKKLLPADISPSSK